MSMSFSTSTLTNEILGLHESGEDSDKENSTIGEIPNGISQRMRGLSRGSSKRDIDDEDCDKGL